jgi:uncharacterized protein with ParB-like and HNH nuclease domain
MNIEKAFITEGTSVFDFFQKPGVGFYIPLYQRQYSWDNNNVEQLLDDILKGIETLIYDNDELRFLGTIITVVENNPNKIQPVDRSGLPPTVQFVIDGQQRLSTISLFSSVLYQKLTELENRIPNSDESAKDELVEAIFSWKEKLMNIFSFDLQRGKPRRKPKIIRGSQDKWVKNGSIKSNYNSDVANYLAQFIDHANGELSKVKFDSIDTNSHVPKNIKQIEKWLNNIIHTHSEEEEEFPSAWEIIGDKKITENYIWGYKREYLMSIVDKQEADNKKSIEYIVNSAVQLFAVCHYLLERCCFTSIQPVDDKWAFDMFQSLNATGTPLTAIETFKPLVVNTTEQHKENFKESKNKADFDKIEKLFKDTKSANRKSRLTSDFLASLSTSVDGKATSSHFSDQRKWLGNTYNTLNKNNDADGYKFQCQFLDYMASYATFYKDVWIDYTGQNNKPLLLIEDENDAALASVIVLFLKESNHKMAITLLAQFYAKILKNKKNAKSEFIEICKTIAAFYIIWRSARSNAGLDNVYRHFFKGFESKDGSFVIERHLWKDRIISNISAADVKNYLISVLEREKIKLSSKKEWLESATSYLSYKNKKICKFTLLIAFHDSISDTSTNGLMKKGRKGISDYLSIEKWTSDDLKSLEHIAPQTQNSYWDKELYEKNLINSIGNLTLLPQDLNSSVGNKSWKEKVIYYLHVNVKDIDQRNKLKEDASDLGINLKNETIELLRNANYHQHMDSITNVADWNSDIVEKRTKRILEITWESVYHWLF